MSKRYYLPPMTAKHPDLPFDLQINRDRVYYRALDGSLRKADSLIHPHTRYLSVSIPGYQITIKGYDKEKKEFIIDVFKEATAP